uniref:Uncharacterized protein n=1 Tax=Lepeophtheirus salmonis TaxID=72036 RepID=A0A0K2SYP0_LEPSM
MSNYGRTSRSKVRKTFRSNAFLTWSLKALFELQRQRNQMLEGQKGSPPATKKKVVDELTATPKHGNLKVDKPSEEYSDTIAISFEHLKPSFDVSSETIEKNIIHQQNINVSYRQICKMGKEKKILLMKINRHEKKLFSFSLTRSASKRSECKAYKFLLYSL